MSSPTEYLAPCPGAGSSECVSTHLCIRAGLSRLYSLVELDLSHNRVSLVSELGHLGSLPCLEALDLSHNPVTQVADYRPHALLAFGPRVTEVRSVRRVSPTGTLALSCRAVSMLQS